MWNEKVAEQVRFELGYDEGTSDYVLYAEWLMMRQHNGETLTGSELATIERYQTDCSEWDYVVSQAMTFE